MKKQHGILLTLLVILAPGQSCADEIRVAVASNFRDAMSALASQFERESNHQVTLIFGSSGKQFAQIRNGAPFDAFFSADSTRPELLEREALEAMGIWNQLGKRLVRGENIGQAFQFVNSGNAEVGLVAWSQLKRSDAAIEGSYWLVPAHYYSPIEQQAILLQDTVGARMFMSFIRSADSARIIRAHGYDLP